MITVTEIPKAYRVEYDGLTGAQFDAAKQWLGENGVSYETHEGDGLVSFICLVQANPDQRAAFETEVLQLPADQPLTVHPVESPEVQP